MRLPDPFTNPDLEGLGFKTALLQDVDPVIRDELPNGSVAEVKSAAQYYAINITYADLFPEEYRFLNAFIKEYKRTREYIEVLLPQYEALRVRGDTTLCSIPSGQKGSTIIINNIKSLVGKPKPGDLFQLSSHPKVYEITSIITTPTNWTINVYPELFITTNGSEKPRFNGILFRTKLLNGDSFGVPLNSDGVYSGVTLNLRESL